MEHFLWFGLTGLMEGSVYALIALSFVLIYKATGVFNLAQGELVCITALVCWSLMARLGLSIWISFPMTLVAGALMGILIERGLIRPLVGQSVLAMVMMTIAGSQFLRNSAYAVWGGRVRGYPQFMGSTTAGFEIGSVFLSQQHVYIFFTALILFAVLSLFFRFSRAGLNMRAVAEGHQTAQGAGINVNLVFSMVWAIAAAVSAFSGVLLGSINGVSVGLTDVALKALPAALIGGLDSILGAIVGGLAMGFLEGMAMAYIDPLIGGGMKDSFAYIVMMIVLFIRPYGLFGLKRIERV